MILRCTPCFVGGAGSCLPGNLQLRASKSNFLKKLSKRWVFSICAKLLKRLFVTSDFFLAQKNRMMQHIDWVHISEQCQVLVSGSRKTSRRLTRCQSCPSFSHWLSLAPELLSPTFLQGTNMPFSLGQASVIKIAQSGVVSGFQDTGS